MTIEKYEIIIEAECNCVDGDNKKLKSQHTMGIQDTDEDKSDNLGVCDNCNNPFKKKKKIKRRIDAKTKMIIPDDEEFIL